MIRKVLTLSLVLFCFFAEAQEPLKKTHYIIHNPAYESTLKYEKALYNTSVDELRFLNERRIISVEGTLITIELYSADELHKAYGKEVSPLTITNAVAARNVKFKLAQNNYNLIVIPDTK